MTAEFFVETVGPQQGQHEVVQVVFADGGPSGHGEAPEVTGLLHDDNPDRRRTFVDTAMWIVLGSRGTRIGPLPERTDKVLTGR